MNIKLDEKKISYLENITKTTDIIYKSIYEIYDLIKFDLGIKETIEKIRSCDDENIQKKLKMKLPTVCFNVNFNNRLIGDDINSYLGLCTIDVDIKEIDFINKLKDYTRTEEHVLMSYISPRYGLKIICRIPICKSKEEYMEYELSLRNHYKDILKKNNKKPDYVDSSSKSPIFKTYLSHDIEAYINLESKTYKNKEVIEHSKYIKVDIDYSDIDSKQIEKYLSKIPSDNYEVWFRVGCALKNQGEIYFNMFDKWSSKSHKYKGTKITYKFWESLCKNNMSNKITLRTILYYYKKNKKSRFQAKMESREKILKKHKEYLE